MKMYYGMVKKIHVSGFKKKNKHVRNEWGTRAIFSLFGEEAVNHLQVYI